MEKSAKDPAFMPKTGGGKGSPVVSPAHKMGGPSPGKTMKVSRPVSGKR